MGRLMALCAARLRPGTDVAERVLNWPGAVGPEAASVPLRLAGALHALKLSGAAPELSAVYPPQDVPDDALWAVVEGCFATHRETLLTWLDSAPQTNEVRRSAALIPALHMVARRTGLPLSVIELGCSGGLNLRCDQYALQAGETVFGPADSAVRLTPDWTGPAPVPSDLRIAARTGIDLNPLDPATPADRLRLLAYLWPDQPDRIARTDAAITLARTHPARLIAAGAEAGLPAVLPPKQGIARVVTHTIAWQYFPPDAQAQALAALSQAGATATADTPLARIGMEWDGDDGAALTLTLWPGGQTHLLARVDFHGRWLRWTGPTAL